MRPEDKEYMSLALAMAGRAAGRTSPNPMVGAVLVKDGRIIGEGCHLCAGTPHAEIHALANAGEKAKDATLYVTLEPCSHHGRTGPCSEAVVRAGVKRVVAAMTDPNPKVAGRGFSLLRDAGIEVEEGVLCAEAARLNEVFIKWVSTGLPFVIMKCAMTLDGKIATVTGQSKWITGPEAREQVHLMRDVCDAIMVGIGTVLADDPELTTRLPAGGQNPVRVIVDSMARTPLTAKVVNDNKAVTIIAVAGDAPQDRIDGLKNKGVEVLTINTKAGEVDLRELFRVLAKRDITSILLEGGAALNAAALAENLIDKVVMFIAPKIVGGAAAPGPVGGQGIQLLDNAVRLEAVETVVIGQDILISGYVQTREGRDVYRACGRTWQS